MKYQIPSTNAQINSNDQSPKLSFFSLEFGDWVLFGIWNLEFGISNFGGFYGK
jgi:hypothetical protein